MTRAGRARVGVGADADGRLCGALLRHLPPAALQGDGASRSHHDPARLGHLTGHHHAGIRRSQDVPPLSGRPADRLADYLQAGLESPGAPPPALTRLRFKLITSVTEVIFSPAFSFVCLFLRCFVNRITHKLLNRFS